MTLGIFEEMERFPEALHVEVEQRIGLDGEAAQAFEHPGGVGGFLEPCDLTATLLADPSDHPPIAQPAPLGQYDDLGTFLRAQCTVADQAGLQALLSRDPLVEAA